MPVIVFIIDNSASMNQTTYLGTSYLDLAKSAIENFLKIRSRDQLNARSDRYMLLTLDEPPTNIKVGWKEHMSIFTNELKNLRASALTNINPVLKQAFDLLNLNRLSAGMDTFGQGRCPFYLEPSLIILITDGGKLMNATSTYDELNLPLTNCPMGSELTVEPFRWDQRFFLISLNMGSVPIYETNQNTFIPYATNSPINSMCEVTGGRSYLISTQRMLYQCLESLVGKIQAGVVINFEKFGNDPPSLKNEDQTLQIASDRLWEKCRRMIFIPKNTAKGYVIGHWPIPEDYWLVMNSPNLPKRNAHPFVRFKCDPSEPMAIDEIPFDKYELEPSPLTQFILERRQPNVAWQCYVPNSGPNSKQNENGFPFGYLKASTNMMSVNLFVLPYNYPVLFQLINELFQNLKLKPTKAWTDKFDHYLKSIPPYYYGPLRRVLSKKGLQHLIAENLENCLSLSVQNYLKKVKNQAKINFDQVCAHPTMIVDSMTLISSNPSSLIYKRQMTDSYSDSKEFNLWLQNNLDPMRADLIRQQFAEYNNFVICVRERRKTKPISYKDPAEIPRNKLIESLQKMRTNFFYKFKSADEDDLHSISIQDMGNYHEYLKNQAQPLRELETQMVRQHMFGNPFKLVSKDQKTSMFGADEIDEVFEESAENIQHQQQKSQVPASSSTTQSNLKRGAGSGSSQVGGPANKRRGASKGPLSKRINYLKNLYTTNTNGSSSIVSDSDIDLLDDTLSNASGFSTAQTFLSTTPTTDTTTSSSLITNNEKQSITQPVLNSNSDVANLNDFLDVEMQSIETNDDEFKIQIQQQQRPISANSNSSSSSSSNEALDINPIISSTSECLCDNYLEQYYVQRKKLCIEQVKKAGQDYSELFSLLHSSLLTPRMIQFLINELIHEASRFKRNNLIESMNKYSSLLAQLNTASVTPINNNE